jgi:hypothetical protein
MFFGILIGNNLISAACLALLRRKLVLRRYSRSFPMETMLLIAGALMTSIPFAIAYKRKCASFVLIDLLSFFLSWTLIGWVAAMAWAIWGKSDPQEFSRQTVGWLKEPLKK